MFRIAVLGATGRMGKALVRLIAGSDDLTLVGAATEPGDDLVGQDAGVLAGAGQLDVVVTDDVDQAVTESQVAVDFTLPAATLGNVDACINGNVALVMGTTGLADSQIAALDRAGQSIAVVYGRNMSVGINVMTELVRLATHTLGPGYDVEISEAHHRGKLDSPSGTALQLGEAVAETRGSDLEKIAVYDRQGVSTARDSGSIGFQSIRAGSIVGDHTVMLVGNEEIIELRHRALNREVFAQGALRAARWVADRPAGLYSMNDVLGLAGR